MLGEIAPLALPTPLTGGLVRSLATWQVESTDTPRDFVDNVIYHDVASLAGFDYTAHATAVSNALLHGYGLIPHWDGMFTDRGLTVKCYNMADAKPRPPLATVTYTPTTWLSAPLGPREVAVCMSYYCNVNAPKYRGRLYIGPWKASQMAENAGSLPNLLLDLGAGLAHANTTNGATWVLYSPTANAHYKITNVWGNDLWDTMSSREQKETARYQYTVP